MVKVSYKQRIISLIELNKTNAEIKKIIYEEYNIVIQLSDIELKRNSNYIVRFNEIEKTGKETTEKLIKNILVENLNYPLTKKEIIYKIFKKYKLNISRDEVKYILWGKLKNEIIYDKNDWTYSLKNIINNDFEDTVKQTLIEYLKNNISEIIKELFGKIQFSQTVTFSEEFLYNEVNDIHDFDIQDKLCYDKLQKTVLENFSLLKRTYTIIQNITSLVFYKNDIIENDINESDLYNFLNIFNELFDLDGENIKIKNKFLFNQTKDELEFLYEAYEKYFKKINKLDNLKLEVENLSNQNNQFIDEIKLNDNTINEELLINDIKYKIFKKKELFKPIFYYNFNSSNGDNEIIINLSHELYKAEYEEFIIKIACAMYYTKSTMTSNLADIFVNRLLSNLALIHE